jgi:hypothetical protein
MALRAASPGGAPPQAGSQARGPRTVQECPEIAPPVQIERTPTMKPSTRRERSLSDILTKGQTNGRSGGSGWLRGRPAGTIGGGTAKPPPCSGQPLAGPNTELDRRSWERSGRSRDFSDPKGSTWAIVGIVGSPKGYEILDATFQFQFSGGHLKATSRVQNPLFDEIFALSCLTFVAAVVRVLFDFPSRRILETVALPVQLCPQYL